MGDSIATTRFGYSWMLWYHDPENKDYSLGSYVRVADVSTPQQFWTIVDSIKKEAWESGMFFFMRKGFNPLWDSPENEHGGSWSKKIEASIAYDTFIDMMVHCVSDEILNANTDTIAGITLSPKGAFSIVKIWNTLTTASNKLILNSSMKGFKIGDDVTYTAHKSRPK
jgi:hypothetical protein